jgi:ankyrin repeat protein
MDTTKDHAWNSDDEYGSDTLERRLFHMSDCPCKHCLNESFHNRVRKLRRGKRNLTDLSYLEVAVYAKDSTLVDLLLDQEPNPYWGTSMVERNRLLIQLIRKIKKEPWGFEFVEKLINNHALDVEIDKKNGSGRTALNEAITFNSQAIAKLLLAKGANVNYLQKIGGLSPLMDAIFDRTGDKLNVSMAYLLLRYNADITYKTSSQTSTYGMTVLDVCTMTERVDMIRFVIAQNPDDIVAFKKVLCLAYSYSGVPSEHQNELRPKFESKCNISPAVAPLLNAIRNAESRLKHGDDNKS